MPQLEFDEEVAKQVEALYRIRDAERRRGIVRGALASAPGERILDVGCGPGFYCAELLEEVGPEGEVVGIDSSAPMLELAARRCAGSDNVSFHEADALALPVEEGSFDGAVCVQVLEYVADATAGLAEIRRALRPGGRAVIWDVDWATLSMQTANPERMERVLGAWDTHAAHVSLPRTLAPRMREAGFEEVRMEAHPFATCEFDRETYGGALVEFGGGVMVGLGAGEDDVEAWAAEQRDLGERGGFFFSVTQFCFTGKRA